VTALVVVSTASTVSGSRRRLRRADRRRLAKSEFAVTVVLYGKADDLASAVSSFVSGLPNLLEQLHAEKKIEHSVCSKTKPCTALKQAEVSTGSSSVKPLCKLRGSVQLESKDRFPLEIGELSGQSLFAMPKSQRILTKEKYGSKFVLKQDVSVLNQRGSNAFAAWLGGSGLKRTTTGLKSAPNHHPVINFVLRTKVIYHDSDAVSAWVWTSGPGFSRIKGQEVRLLFTNKGSTKTLSCGIVSQTRGQNCIRSLGQTGWFSEKESVTVSVQAIKDINGARYKTKNTEELSLGMK
jgi:hypothetical protein